MKKYVIIGNGTAAVGCIEGIRTVDKSGKITVISAENHSVYSRPLISYYLEGKTDLQRMKYRDDGFYIENGCKVLYGKIAKSIDADKKTVVLDGGEKIQYDELCVASGSRPFVPPFEGLETVTNKF
ncbi:MAG: FAD-dependent oxidoreductase, partial [Clostridia bacterium]|nr:FAD-dependent oxidoreductase [Clostridia bacterium]